MCRVCFVMGVNVAQMASLSVAVLDLKVVQDVIGAMRAADAGAAAADNSPVTLVPILDQARHITPDPVYAPRHVIHRDPCYAPRRVIHLQPRDESQHTRLALIDDPQPAQLRQNPHCPTIKPVWATLPSVQPLSSTTQVKVFKYTTDIEHKGSLLDMFI